MIGGTDENDMKINEAPRSMPHGRWTVEDKMPAVNTGLLDLYCSTGQITDQVSLDKKSEAK